ncbi:MAG: hypothetical protein JST89_12590 [Cyanobacteria bacterium SZAS-4]|nr:hypothetical protein [Cyanobacteria bacterium SZAS-4]
MEYDSTRVQYPNIAQQGVRQETVQTSPRSLHDQVVNALPPVGKKRSIASDFGVGPPPLLSY